MKPIAWYDPSNGVVSTDKDSPLFTPLGQVWALYSEPVHERFLVATIGNWGRVEWADGVFPSLGDKMYSAPRTWVGLTNDEVNNLAAGCHLGNSVQDAIYKAVAKLKEKNNA
jgi:hypothetical protein